MNNWIQSVHKIAQTVSVRSALNPLLWLSAIFGLPSLFLATVASDETRFFFFAIVASLLGADLIAFFYFAISNPAYLRSEAYQLRHHALALLGDKDNRLGANAEDIKGVSNPLLPLQEQPDITEV